MMKKIVVLFGIFVLTLVLALWSNYNGIVTGDEDINAAWSEVQNQLKRRADLIPNLVHAVQAFASHEREVFVQVTKDRANVSRAINVDIGKLANDPTAQQRLLEAQQTLNASLSRLIAVSENYPELKANENFIRLQDELAGTENRITVARGRAIDATNIFNRSIRKFPTNFIARMFGYNVKTYYVAPVEDQRMPVLFKIEAK